MHDVEPRLFTTVIREMIRHENDVTNHRLMWLLIGQGLIANAYVSATSGNHKLLTVLALVGMLVAFSAFIILYKSYQARGYLEFLGNLAKAGSLTEQWLPLLGWPAKRIKGWRRNVWLCPWLGRFGELLEPYFFLPSLLMLAWLYVLLRQWLSLADGLVMILAVLLVLAFVAGLCLVWVWSESRKEVEA
jgi:hypothetical protein